MRILLTGGGTAGHINPAIAIAQYFKANDKDSEILYVGTPNGMEVSLVKKAGFNFKSIEVTGFSRSIAPKDIWHNVKALEKAVLADGRAKKIIKEFKPDVVVGTGGYVSGPVVLAAVKLGIKTAIHEQNSFPGVTNRILAPKVDMVFLADSSVKGHLKGDFKYQVVGNPIKPAVIMQSRAEARAELKLNDEFCILSCGGSLGANGMNLLAADLIEWHCKNNKNICHIHGYGRNGREKFPALLKERNIDIEKYPAVKAVEYIDNMNICLAAADLLICRAGAMTVSEVKATGKPAIFLPSPNVTENHQYFNAMSLVENDAAMLIEEKDYSKEKLIAMVEELYENPDRCRELSQNASKLAILDTAKRIYDTVKTL